MLYDMRHEVEIVGGLCADRVSLLLADDTSNASGTYASVVSTVPTGGRPRLSLSANDISYEQMGTWRRVADALGVSESTLRRRRIDHGLQRSCSPSLMTLP